jgi:hypothetical protein
MVGKSDGKTRQLPDCGQVAGPIRLAASKSMSVAAELSGVPARGGVVLEPSPSEVTMTPSHCHVSLRTAITLPFVILFNATVLLQSVLQRQGIERLIEDENNYLLSQIGASMVAGIDHFLAMAETA